MKNYITILLMSLAIIGCQAPTADPDGRTLIDPSDLIAVSEAFSDALNTIKLAPVTKKKTIAFFLSFCLVMRFLGGLEKPNQLH